MDIVQYATRRSRAESREFLWFVMIQHGLPYVYDLTIQRPAPPPGTALPQATDCCTALREEPEVRTDDQQYDTSVEHDGASVSQGG